MEPHWLVRPRTLRWLRVSCVAGLAGTVLLQLVLPVEGHFGIDASLGFSAWFGFAVCAVMIVIARILGLLLKRPDDYYGKDP